MDYRLFDRILEILSERKHRVLVNQTLYDLAPNRTAKNLLSQMIAEDQILMKETESLYQSKLKQLSQPENRNDFFQIMSYAEGLEESILEELLFEQTLGRELSKTSDITLRETLFIWFSHSNSCIQRYLYLLIHFMKNNAEEKEGTHDAMAQFIRS